nr:flagellar assembly protein A [uncultured Desulfobacter sp.]
MTQTKKHRIFLVETDTDLQQRIQKLIRVILGYEVMIFDSTQSALEALEILKKNVISLIISSYRMNMIKGDEMLQKAKAISIQSRRMLITDVSNIEIMINAINTADIHSCLVLPFKDADLVNQVKNQCAQYNIIQKKKNLSRVTRRQNHQLFKLASDLKLTDEKQVKEIQRREAEIERLKKESASTPPCSCALASVKDHLEQRCIEITPQTIEEQWRFLESRFNDLFFQFASHNKESIYRLSYQEIKNLPATGNEYRKASPNLLLSILDLLPQENLSPGMEKESMASFAVEGLLDDYLDLGFSKDKVQAFIKIKKYNPKVLTLKSIKIFLRDNQVVSGLRADQEILSWIEKATETSPAFAVAEGKAPVFSKNAEIRYHFKEDYLQPGKLKEDGTIDFTDRGKIPFVKKDTFLAAKIDPVQGVPGKDVSGQQIPVPEPEDLIFEAGPGARMDKAGGKIYADTDGQPSLNALGKVSVLSELEINGDVDFQSGNVDFEGNLLVKGSIKEGFTVKAASLTCNQIEGGRIELSGNLNCSAGIINAKLIAVNGTIQAKYVNNSVVDSFGDMIIQKEIVDSKIQISGRLINPRGSILSSKICAKGGIEIGNVGTEVSTPSTLTVGKDLYIEGLIARSDHMQSRMLEIISQLANEIRELNKEDSQLHAKISENAYLQDRYQVELKDIEKKKFNLKASGNMLAYHKVLQTADKLEKQIQNAEEDIEVQFERQDAIAYKITHKKNRIGELEKKIRSYEKEKDNYLEISARKKAVPEVIVTKRIMSGNVVNTPNVQKRFNRPATRCRIVEIKYVRDGMFLYEIEVNFK